jgi:hypothetical protein
MRSMRWSGQCTTQGQADDEVFPKVLFCCEGRGVRGRGRHTKSCNECKKGTHVVVLKLMQGALFNKRVPFGIEKRLVGV